MEARTEKIQRFLRILSELMDGKYSTAEEKISEALEALAASNDLRELFTAVAKGFDYPAVRAACLRFPAYKGAAHGAAYLPAERKDILAFVFCLFMEIDRGSLSLGDFLLRYFYVDGSYTAGFLLFSDRMVRPFAEILKDCFPEAAKGGDSPLGELSVRLAAEPARLQRFGLHEEEQAAADLILGELKDAVTRGDVSDIAALLAGYRYLLRYIGGEDEESAALFSTVARL